MEFGDLMKISFETLMESPEPQWLLLDELLPDSGRVAETKKTLAGSKSTCICIYHTYYLIV